MNANINKLISLELILIESSSVRPHGISSVLRTILIKNYIILETTSIRVIIKTIKNKEILSLKGQVERYSRLTVKKIKRIISQTMRQWVIRMEKSIIMMILLHGSIWKREKIVIIIKLSLKQTWIWKIKEKSISLKKHIKIKIMSTMLVKKAKANTKNIPLIIKKDSKIVSLNQTYTIWCPTLMKTLTKNLEPLSENNILNSWKMSKRIS